MSSSSTTTTSLSGKVIAVTGAASGMGFATAKVLYARGAHLSLTDIREDALAKAVAEIEQQQQATNASTSSSSSSHEKSTPTEIITTVVDIRQSSQVDAWIAKTVDHFGRLDGAANVAGVLGRGFGVSDITEIGDEEFDFITNTNFKGLFNCIRAELRVMTKQAQTLKEQKENGGAAAAAAAAGRRGPGCIVNAASSTGLEGHPKNSVYSATKHAVIGLTKSAAGEVGALGVRVNCVAPGIINTPMTASVGALDAGKLESTFSRVSLGRMGTVEEAADIFAFLLSDESSYVTGATFLVDGGMLS